MDRVAPGQAVTFAVYEKVRAWLEGGAMDQSMTGAIADKIKDAKDAVSK